MTLLKTGTELWNNLSRSLSLIDLFSVSFSCAAILISSVEHQKTKSKQFDVTTSTWWIHLEQKGFFALVWSSCHGLSEVNHTSLMCSPDYFFMVIFFPVPLMMYFDQQMAAWTWLFLKSHKVQERLPVITLNVTVCECAENWRFFHFQKSTHWTSRLLGVNIFVNTYINYILKIMIKNIYWKEHVNVVFMEGVK